MRLAFTIALTIYSTVCVLMLITGHEKWVRMGPIRFFLIPLWPLLFAFGFVLNVAERLSVMSNKSPLPTPSPAVLAALENFKIRLKQATEAAREARAAMNARHEPGKVDDAERKSADAQLRLKQARHELDCILLDE